MLGVEGGEVEHDLFGVLGNPVFDLFSKSVVDVDCVLDLVGVECENRGPPWWLSKDTTKHAVWSCFKLTPSGVHVDEFVPWTCLSINCSSFNDSDDRRSNIARPHARTARIVNIGRTSSSSTAWSSSRSTQLEPRASPIARFRARSWSELYVLGS